MYGKKFFLALRERNGSTAAYAIASGRSLKKKNLMPHLLFQEFLMRNREFFYLALSFKAGNTLSESEAVDAMQKCIRDIQDWMAKNRLKMNDGKTKFVISGTRQQLGKHSVTRLSVGNTPYRDYNICQESWSMNGPQVVF